MEKGILIGEKEGDGIMEGKPDKKFLNTMLLILFGVGFYVGLSNLPVVAESVWTVVSLFTPLIVGGVIAFILNVPMHFFEKQCDKIYNKKKIKLLKTAKGPICLVVTLIAFVAAISLIVSVIVPNLVDSITTLVEGVKENLPVWIDWLKQHQIDTTFIENALAKIDVQSILNELQSNLGRILSSAGSAAGSVVGVLSNLAFGLIFAIYILMSKKKLGIQAKQLVYAYLKKSWADNICEVASLTYKTFSSFLSGQCLEACILGGMFCIVLLIGGFPCAVTIGVIIGSMALIPFIGAFIGLAFGILLILVEAPSKILWFIIIFFVVQQIEGNLIYPKVVGGSVGLPAIWTLLAVVVGGSVSGIFGIIVFIPIFSVIYALIRRSVHSRLKDKKIRVEG